MNMASDLLSYPEYVKGYKAVSTMQGKFLLRKGKMIPNPYPKHKPEKRVLFDHGVCDGLRSVSK